jgi:hypothetical protein
VGEYVDSTDFYNTVTCKYESTKVDAVKNRTPW